MFFKSTAVLAILWIGVASAYANSARILLAEFTSQPIGHYEFCKRIPTECRPNPVSVEKFDSAWALGLAATVNSEVNQKILPESDLKIYGKAEVWAYPTQGLGDCEDYVLEKRRRLQEAGLPLSKLLITVVRKADGEGHAVLLLRLEDGDYVLDNLRGWIVPWSRTDYRFLKAQDPGHSGKWRTIRTGRSVAAASSDR